MLEALWYSRSKLCWILWPLHLLVRLVSAYRLTKLKKGANYCPVPVVVVGNVTVGGTGKTPVVIELVRFFQRQNLQVAVISRGYGAVADCYPLQVSQDTRASECGDEPLLIHQATGAMVVVDPVRKRAYEYALASQQCDIVISDDGLQHFQLPRTLEIAVVDKERGIGNGLCLPVGPLRESAKRLRQVDFVVGTGQGDFSPVDYNATNRIEIAKRLDGQQQKPLTSFKGLQVTAIAGIGNPNKFFAALTDFGIKVKPMPKPDHYQYQTQDFISELPILLTEKDAVKCRAFMAANPNLAQNIWVVPLQTHLPSEFFSNLLKRLELQGETNG